MTAGLDEWPFAREESPPDWFVREERLQARLNVTHFRLPPEFREPGEGVQHANQFIPFVRFPLWHYCPLRGAMEKLALFGGRMKCPCRPGLDCYKIPDGKRPYLIPSRFIAICPKGHIEDFPFMKWVHRGGVSDKAHKLRLLAGRSSTGLSGIKVACSCKKKESLASSFNFTLGEGGALHKLGHDCTGSTPWLGRLGGRHGQCGEFLRVVQRGASNVYFPVTMSSIYLPLWGEETSRTINKILDQAKVWDMLVSGLDDGRYIQASRCEAVASIYQVDAKDLREAAQRKLDGHVQSTGISVRSEEEFRRQEYEALRCGRGGTTTDLLVDVRTVSGYGQDLGRVLERICLVRKLRETRTLIGFSRVLPVEDSAPVQLLPISEDESLKWLPAVVVYGEGIFLEFRTDVLEAWGRLRAVEGRVATLASQFNRRRTERGLGRIPVTAKYILLHTFAHALINQMSFDCGYGSASLRERIYCGSEESGTAMNGILIYTASGDSEGTLGGLVRQGEPDRLQPIVDQAIRRIRWCSSDPVCIESTGQGSDNANLAACHSCTLLAETSCEKGNRLLDRGLLIGTPRQSEIGFFLDD